MKTNLSAKEQNENRMNILAKLSLVKVPEGYDAVLNGERVASVFKGWSRVGGAGWQFCMANCGISLTKKSLEDARRSIAEKLSRA